MQLCGAGMCCISGAISAVMASWCREFQEDAFLPFVGSAFQALTRFLQSAEEFNTQIQASTCVLLLPGSPWSRGSPQWLSPLT